MKVNSQTGQTSSIGGTVYPAFSKALKIPASVISIIFHPFLIPIIGTWLIIHLHYYQFAGFQKDDIIHLYGSVLTNTVILPFATVFLLSVLKFISSMRMERKQDRIVPYMALMTFYFWAFLVFNKQAMMPDSIKVFILGLFIASILGFLSNLQIKISLHGIGMGSLIGLLLCFFGSTSVNITIFLMAVFLATGLVATSRLVVGRHSSLEVYLGIFFGIFAQLLALWIL